MSYLNMVEAKLPPGFRFHPRDDELICDYLVPKIISDDGDSSNYSSVPCMIDVDLNKCEPWDLPVVTEVAVKVVLWRAPKNNDVVSSEESCRPNTQYVGQRFLQSKSFEKDASVDEMACVGSKEWYFFNLRDRKYATGQRTNRATMSGYWKATGKDRHVVRKEILVGMRKTLVFYQGRAPKGKKTDWIMHEFRSEGRSGPPSRLISCKEDWALCRVFYKSRGLGVTSKHVTIESYCDDTSSSSLPPLSDTYVALGQCNFQPPLPLPLLSTPAINIMCNNFSATTTASLEQVPCFSNYIQMPNQTKDLASSCFKYVYDQLSKLEEKHQQEASSGSFLTETALSSSMWYPFQS